MNKKTLLLTMAISCLSGCLIDDLARNYNAPKPTIKVEYYEDGSKKSETPYVNEKKNGLHIAYYEDGTKMAEIPYVDGNKHGTYIAYHEDGSRNSVTPYENGLEHGMAVVYRTDGSKVRETPYAKGERHGNWIVYNEYGSKSRETCIYMATTGSWIVWKDGSCRKKLSKNDKVISNSHSCTTTVRLNSFDWTGYPK